MNFGDQRYEEEALIEQFECLVESGQTDLVRAGMKIGGENLDEIFGNCMPRLYRVADRVLHNSYDSEDALQDGLLSAVRHIDQFKGNSQFSTWLFSIIRNSALANLRKRRSHAMVSMDDQTSKSDWDTGEVEISIDPRPDPEQICAREELSVQFAETLATLPAKYRAIIRLCDIEGYTGREVAKRLGLSVSALKAQHHRARQALRKSLSCEGGRKSP